MALIFDGTSDSTTPNWATAQLTVQFNAATLTRGAEPPSSQAASGGTGPSSYVNFDLVIERTADGYLARLINSPLGQASTTFVLPPSASKLAGGLTTGGDGDHLPQLLDPERFGRELYAALFANQMGTLLHSSLDLARQDGVGLRLRLRLNDVPELVALPWEFLYNTPEGHFYLLSEETPLVRFIELSQPVRPLPVRLPLRLLTVMSAPVSIVPSLHLEREWQLLQQGLKDLQQRHQIHLERTEATVPNLQRLLLESDCHILLFTGPSWYNETTGEVGLVLEDEKGAGYRIAAQQLSRLLSGHRSLRLIFLHTGESAHDGVGQPSIHLAEQLVQSGFPAVIVMQYPILDRAAIQLTAEFYKALVDGSPVDAALNTTRKAIFALEGSSEWAAPALFSRSHDNRLFAIQDTVMNSGPAWRGHPPQTR